MKVLLRFVESRAAEMGEPGAEREEAVVALK